VLLSGLHYTINNFFCSLGLQYCTSYSRNGGAARAADDHGS